MVCRLLGVPVFERWADGEEPMKVAVRGNGEGAGKPRSVMSLGPEKEGVLE